jgi:hypothetical protein
VVIRRHRSVQCVLSPDLSVLLRRPLAHDVVHEVDSVDAVGGPGSLSVEEGLQVNKVDLTGPAEVDGMLVAAGTGLSGTSLLVVEIDGDAGVNAIQLLAGPGELVAIEDPEVSGLTELGLDLARVPDLADQNTLGVVQGVTGVVELEGVSTGP